MTHPSSSDIDDPMLELQQEYIREAPARLAELRKDLLAFRAGEPDALESLRARFHRLAGSGGSYGFQRVTDVARAMEHRILTPPVPTIREAETFAQAIHDLEDAFNSAAGDVGLPAAIGRIPGFGWRTLLVMVDTGPAVMAAPAAPAAVARAPAAAPSAPATTSAVRPAGRTPPTSC